MNKDVGKGECGFDLQCGCTLDIGRGLGGPIVRVWYHIQSDQMCVWRFGVVEMVEEKGWSMQGMASQWRRW